MGCFFIRFLGFLPFFRRPFKWKIFSRPGKLGSGRNIKSLFFLLGLKYTFRTCFESKKFLPKSCSLRYSVFQFVKFVSSFRVRVRQTLFNFLTSDGQVWS